MAAEPDRRGEIARESGGFSALALWGRVSAHGRPRAWNVGVGCLLTKAGQTLPPERPRLCLAEARTGRYTGGTVLSFRSDRQCAWVREPLSDTPRGATASARLYSLIETAKLNGLEPYHYLRTVFRELPATRTPEQIEALLPYNLDAPDLADPATARKRGVG